MSEASGFVIQTANVWARPLDVDRNLVRQLLVPRGRLEVLNDDGQNLWVTNNFGRWPATRAPYLGDDSPLTAQLPAMRTTGVRAAWLGSHALMSPQLVVESFEQAIGFRHHTEPQSLRRPQVGALHSVLGYWASGLPDPGIIVMPTGTGKTETMLALLVAARMERLLVIVPTKALRDQIGKKFETLGILHELGIVDPKARRPTVGRVEHGFHSPDNAAKFASACNVVIATPQVLGACTPEAREALLSRFSHLMVDEAHHAPAPSWADVIQTFGDRPVLLFTATPFREDGRKLPGRILFRFPLREAQRDRYFTQIDYRAVLSLGDTDQLIADLALDRLRRDLADGYDHILMARGASVRRAEDLVSIYKAKAPELGPQVLHDRLPERRRKQVLAALEDRTSRIVVCVDMLGEGFDLPSLKVAALHDVKKSLSPMIQFIGRFSRTSAKARIGSAAAFVARDPSVALSPLRDLLREDADWNLLLRDITERATETVEGISAFEASFAGAPDDVSVSLLEPKMSAIAYRAPGGDWQPERAVELYGDEQVVDGRVATGAESSVAWFVLEKRSDVRWGSVKALEQLTYELVIMYFDEVRRLLYIHGSDNNGGYRELAEAVLGEGSQLIKGPTTFRVLAHLDRLIPTNVGLLDARDHFNRFSMHVGSDVLEALDINDRQGKSQTHIATSGFDQGERVNISASLSGRFWSMRTAPNLKSWTEWCDEQGAKLTDNSINLQEVLSGFIIPEDLTERPPHVLLGLEWPWEIFTGLGPGVSVTVDGKTYPITDVGFAVDDFEPSGPFSFSLVTPAWRIRYLADFEPTGLRYRPIEGDAEVASRPAPVPMVEWINKNKPTLFLEGDRMITPEDRLLVPRYDLSPFDRQRLISLDWAGVDIQVESQGTERRTDSIQAFTSAYLRRTEVFDVLIDDDRAGEAADLVGLRINETELVVTLIHCKYSSQPTAGSRLADLYELCGQAMRGAKWRQQGADPLLRHLDRRAQRYAQRTGFSPYEAGSIDELYKIRQIAPQLRPRFRTVLVQPGLSASASTEEQLRLLAGAESYVRAVTKGSFDVYCST
ncbi:DEAD/DEAH box helicase [Micromonospora tulbaghiae]|uniref:DEAD/DEAH box helicase n=1 Tax=Micromonospora tulbaghiae TaxID=479978 RepID=UPI00197BA312|nr:DEAD/DEAH box helicase family protein [Micromonospora tulbaghiae]